MLFNIYNVVTKPTWNFISKFNVISRHFRTKKIATSFLIRYDVKV